MWRTKLYYSSTDSPFEFFKFFLDLLNLIIMLKPILITHLRYVIIGNHRDAWGYGASDPSSGTAPLMEMARVLGERVRGGWRPRRSIVMVSWAAEEMGLMGSWEWSMDKIHKLTHRYG